MTISQSYDSSVNAWRAFLERSTDLGKGIEWGENLRYFSDIVHQVLDRDFDRGQLGKTMYRHPLAGFYRWNILDGISSKSEFEAKFHVFPDISRTHIHAHGYEGKSHILEGSMNVFTFNPNDTGEAIAEMLKPLQTHAFQRVGEIQTPFFKGAGGGWDSVMAYIEKLTQNPDQRYGEELTELNNNFGIKNLAAFQQLQGYVEINPSIKIEIENDIFQILTGESLNYGHYTGFLIHVVLGLESVLDFAKYFFHDRGDLLKLDSSKKFRVGKGETHNVGLNQAHSVEVLEPDTSTLFLTKKPRNSLGIQQGGEFHNFPQDQVELVRYQASLEEAREYIFTKLEQIYT